MRRTIGPGTSQTLGTYAQFGVDSVNAERIFSYEKRLQFQDLLVGSNGRATICLSNTIRPIRCRDLYKGVRALGGNHHALDIANCLAAGDLLGMQLQRRKDRESRRSEEEPASRKCGFHVLLLSLLQKHLPG